MKSWMLIAVLGAAILFPGCGCDTVEPGNRGVEVSWGVVNPVALQEGFVTYGPGVNIHQVSVRQQKRDVKAPCFSSDLQQVDLTVSVLYRIPEKNVVSVFKDFHGEPFDNLIAPRVQESIKEATATRTAEQIVKEREAVKTQALEALRHKVGSTLVVEDLIIADVGLSAQLSKAIEEKMVQQQNAQKATFTKQQAEMDAQTVVAKAEGEAKAALARARAEAESIELRSRALERNPALVQLEMVNKWDGKSPQIIGGNGSGMNIIFPGMNSLSPSVTQK